MGKPSKIKDKILKALIAKECGRKDEEIAKFLNIPSYTIYTLLKEMESAGHIETIETSTPNSMTSCMVRRVWPQGEDFQKRTTYRWQAIKKWWAEAPKNYWIIGALIALISSNAALISKLLSKDKPEIQQSLQPIPNLAKQDTLPLKSSSNSSTIIEKQGFNDSGHTKNKDSLEE